MKLTREQRRVVRTLLRHKSDDFVELAALTGLNPATDFQDADLRGVDFGTANIGDFNFARANLDAADWSRARGTERTVVPPGTASKPPSWADDWGVDDYGRWVSFSVPAADGSPVSQRMRWIPPGRFMRGSPDDEPGRYDDEGPRRAVTIADGFWLFDTPCTQALWQAVMGNNPSRFKSPTRPVEQVSFTDVQAFLRKLNDLLPSLNLGLPSEAQWEYACRAGTVVATYAGEMQILGDYNAPVLDTIAWYGGNSGVGFELDNGYDSSDWPGKQYEHNKAGTHPVAQKAANPWGLYDMLGNVWEWCADHWHDNYDRAPDDGSAWLSRGGGAAARVLRGGSWLVGARYVRAALRALDAPTDRGDFLGFRCARVQSGSEERKLKRRAGRSKPSERSEPAATTSRPQQIGGSSIDRKRQQIVSALARRLGTRLIGKRGVYFESPDDRHRIVCTVSKRHEGRRDPYWYRYEQSWHDFLVARSDGQLVLGGLDLQFAFAIPTSVIGGLRDQLHTTMDGDRVGYWHLNITETTPGNYVLALRNAQSYPLDSYRFELE
jgi:formylglycine-generating enzyme required for sulfatase activity